MYKNESDFNRWWSRELVEVGARVFPIVASARQQPGWPDRYVAHRQWSGWIEGKSERGTLSADQRAVHHDLRIRGVPVAVFQWRGQLGYLLHRDGTRAIEVALRHGCGLAMLRALATHRDWWVDWSPGGISDNSPAKQGAPPAL